MRVRIALIALSAVLLVQANPVPQDVDDAIVETPKRSPQECIDSFRSKLATLEIPDDVKSFVDEVKKLNKPVYSQVNSLIKLMNDERVERDVYRVGIVNEQTSRALAESCGEFSLKMIEASETEGCTDLTELSEQEFEAYTSIMSGISELDEVFGTTQVCYLL